MVICNQKHRCHVGDPTECGGAVPHEPCSECGNCPQAKKLGAKCVDVDSRDIDVKFLAVDKHRAKNEV